MAKIMIVDDTPSEVKILQGIVSDLGHTVVYVATSGEMAIEQAPVVLPDLIFMDLVMPGVDGFKATRHITRQPETAHIPVVIVSTKDQSTDRVWGEKMGAKAYLVKPVSRDDVAGVLSMVLK